MDELDSAIVARLQRDTRQTNRDLAHALGIAPSTCLERQRKEIIGFRSSVYRHSRNQVIAPLPDEQPKRRR